MARLLSLAYKLAELSAAKKTHMTPANRRLLNKLSRDHQAKLYEIRTLNIWKAENRKPKAIMTISELCKIDRLNRLKSEVRKLSIEILRLKQPSLF